MRSLGQTIVSLDAMSHTPSQRGDFALRMTPAAPTRSASYQTLDAWRGLAALSVVLYHVANEMILRQPLLKEKMAYQAMSFGYLGVQVFFVISGYCIANAAVRVLEKDRSVRSFLSARMHRIYPPMLWASLAAAVCKVGVEILVARGTLSRASAPEVSFIHQSFVWYFANLTLTQEFLGTTYLLRIAWTLCYESAFYLIVFLMMVAVRQNRSGKRALLYGLHVVTLLTLLQLIVFPGSRFYPMDLWPEFGAGVLVFDLLTNESRQGVRLWAFVLVLAGLVFVCTSNFPIGASHEPSRLTYIVTGVTAGVLVLLRTFDTRLSANISIRGLSALGIFSYSIYLVHYLVITVLFTLVLRWQLPAFTRAALLSVAAVACGYLFYRLFERPFISRKDRALVPTPIQRLEGEGRVASL